MTTKNKINNVSLKYISELAGVTQSTASRILTRNPNYNYAKSTVEHVLKIAREHGYRTSQIYRSVFTGKTKSVGLISTHSGGFYSRVTKGIHDRLLEDGYAVIMGINTCHYDNPSSSMEKKIIHRLNEHRVDGFIIRPTLDNATDEHFREIIDSKLPLITIDRVVNSKYADYVGSDNIGGGRLAAAYLAELGHRNLVQFTGNLQVSVFRERAAGFESELMKRGHIIQTATCTSLEDVAEKCRMLFSRPGYPTAAFCGNDNIAGVVYDVLRDLKLDIPRNVSVIGFGNEEFSRYLRPRLTTIDQHPYEMGIAVAELFLKRLDEPFSAERTRTEISIDVELLKYDSCGTPRA